MADVTINIVGSGDNPSKNEKFQDFVKSKPDVIIIGDFPKKKTWWSKILGAFREENDTPNV